MAKRLWGCAALFVSFAPLSAEPANQAEFFEMRVRPVLANSCFACHGANRMGQLDLTTREAMVKGGASGPAIVPGDPDNSLLVQAITNRHARIKMPMGGAPLGDKAIADIVTWIKDGAVWPESSAPVAAAAPKGAPYKITPAQRAFWSFQPLRKQAPPSPKNATAASSAIDRFLLAAMESQNIKRVRTADKATLIRRAYFDLTGLPPSYEEVQAFVADRSPTAFAKVVDRLLASKQYGERWARHWLELARYSDDRLESEVDAPYANAFRYRDWVVQAFNEDMPYDVFVKAQIAGDLLDPKNPRKYGPGLGFYALSPDTQEDRVDVTGRVFLGLTTGCAQCHNHKFDPIPTSDYYSLLGIFTSTKNSELLLAPEETAKRYKDKEKQIADKKAQIRDFLYSQASQLQEVLAAQTARYLKAARAVAKGESVADVARRQQLDRETLERWTRYVSRPAFDHPYLKDWANEAAFDAEKFQARVIGVLKERKQVDETNLIRKAEAKSKGPAARVDLVALENNSYYLWRDLFFNDFYGNQFKQEDDGLLYYGPNRGFYESDGTVERFLDGVWKNHLANLRAEFKQLSSELPPAYPFAHVIADSDKPKNEKIRISGSAENLGPEAPRRFLSILSEGEPAAFTKGSGRLELAEAIVDPRNPLTARVMANRIWRYHFGAGIVRTPSDFGRMGDRPSHPELLDYLAQRLINNRWSMKALHREIMLSQAYALSSEHSTQAFAVDPENRLLWRANTRRLDVEALRDSLLLASGDLEASVGGAPLPLDQTNNYRRTLYGFVSRRKLDSTLALFDFPNPNATSEKRVATLTPRQQLFFLNGDFVWDRAKALATRLSTQSTDDSVRIRAAYQRLFARDPRPEEVKVGLDFVAKGSAGWTHYAHALLSSNEFLFVN